ncbi:cation acetate symporter [Psychromicrobium lacuslunae]|uniref:Transporter n=1 Tax=Psychromicrobium lacuslunae TaxID=1618207 RepID=A0A0D4BWP0_9MICC|nr:cation acetate symporter [Psychromicrobium lacuslunae]AJT40516.1 transporter [Psychromicrobium lacuslunae]
MNPLSITTIGLVALATVVVGVFGLRISRTTSDFYVASRTVKPWWNASAIGGEYLSAASYLGVAGLILLSGPDGLWYPVGYTAGYLMLLLFVAAPLRRSGAYTIPDFAEFRLASQSVRKVTSCCVILICWLYLVPQLQGAALTVSITAGLPSWLGPLIVISVVCVVVMTGGMRSITFVQAFQFWLKFTALAVPTVFLLIVLMGNPQSPEQAADAFQMASIQGASSPLRTISLMIGLLFGTLGLPHVLVRFYTNPDGHSARRTTLIVLPLLCLFYLLPTTLGTLGRMHPTGGKADATVLLLPSQLLPGPVGQALTALVIAGAFAAFLSCSSGLLVSLAGVVSQDLFGGSVRGFRLAAGIGSLVPLAVSLFADSSALASSIGAVFAFTASTLCPLLLLGIWWRGLTDVGAIVGIAVGAVLCGGALLFGGLFAIGVSPSAGVVADLLAQPAIVTVPAAFLAMIVVSKLTPHRLHSSVAKILARLHTPESLKAAELSRSRPSTR